MGRNNRQRRKEKKRANSPSKVSKAPSRHLEQFDAKATELALQALSDENANQSLYYSLFRRIGRQRQSLVWRANKNVLDLCLFSRKPDVFSLKDLKEVCQTFETHLDNDYQAVIRTLQSYASVVDWDLPLNPLLDQFLQNESNEISVLDYPAIVHFHSSGLLDIENPATTECLEYIDDWCSEKIGECPIDFVKIFSSKKTLPTPLQLKKFDAWLDKLRKQTIQLNQDPLYRSFIEPSLCLLIKKSFSKPKNAKLANYPNILDFLARDPAGEKANSINTSRGNTAIVLSDLNLDLIAQIRDTFPNVEKTFSQHIAPLVLHWRFCTTAIHEQRSPDQKLKQQEQNAFLALWTALSRGVPEFAKKLASTCKDLCTEYVLDCVSKWPNYRPSSLIINSLAAHKPQLEALTWLQIAATHENNIDLYIKRLSERPKVFSFDLFYALYKVHRLESQPLFIKYYFEKLPQEAQREILLPWFKRAAHGSQSAQEMSLIMKSSFDKLLQPNLFPVSEVLNQTELEDELVVWSLAYRFDRNLPISPLTVIRLKSFLSGLHGFESNAFWVCIGDRLLSSLLPQILKPENVARGILVDLLLLFQKSISTQNLADILGHIEYLESNQLLTTEWKTMLSFLDKFKKPKKTHPRSTQKSKKASNRGADDQRPR